MTQAKSFAVFGLGRFGTSIVSNLAKKNVEILAVDRDQARINDIAELVDHAVVGEASDEELLTKVGIEHFDVVVFAMGEEFESSVMATMIAKEQGAKRVVVKALTTRQAQILTRVGADKVVLPEVEMGARVAKSLVDPDILDMIDQTNGVGIAERHPDPAWVGKTLAEAAIRQRDHIEVLALIREGETLLPVPPTTILQESDILLTIEQAQ